MRVLSVVSPWTLSIVPSMLKTKREVSGYYKENHRDEECHMDEVRGER